MKNRFILDKESIQSNIKQNWKKSIVVFVVFVIVGAICGYVQSSTYHEQKDRSIVFQENTIDLSDVAVDENYYENALRNYIFKETFLDIYLNRYEQLELNQDDQERVEQLKENVENYKNGDYKVLVKYYQENVPVIVDFIPERLKYLNSKKQSLNEKNNQLEMELNEVTSIKYNRYYKGDKEDEIFQKRVKNKEEIEFVNYQIKYLNDVSSSTMQLKCSEFDKMLVENKGEINDLIAKFNELNSILAVNEQYSLQRNDMLYNYYQKNISLSTEVSQSAIDSAYKKDTIVYATSIAGKDSKREIFSAYLTFVLLIGIVVSTLVAICYRRS